MHATSARGAAVDDRHQVRAVRRPRYWSCRAARAGGALNPEETGSFPALQSAASLDQVVLTHHPEHPLGIDRHPEPAAHKRADHPVPVRLSSASSTITRSIGSRIVGHRSRLRRPIQRLPAHPQHARHTQRIPLGEQTARPGDTHAHSQSRDLQLVRLRAQRTLELRPSAATPARPGAPASPPAASPATSKRAPRRSPAPGRGRRCDRRAGRPARSRSSAAPSSFRFFLCSLNPSSPPVERPMLSRSRRVPPTRLQDRPSIQPS